MNGLKTKAVEFLSDFKIGRSLSNETPNYSNDKVPLLQAMA